MVPIAASWVILSNAVCSSFILFRRVCSSDVDSSGNGEDSDACPTTVRLSPKSESLCFFILSALIVVAASVPVTVDDGNDDDVTGKNSAPPLIVRLMSKS